MPFVKQERRTALVDGDMQPEVPGDWCFLEYTVLMDAWKKERRWTTVDTLCQETFGFNQEQSAKFLAFLEFYVRHAHVYENEMVARNGDI